MKTNLTQIPKYYFVVTAILAMQALFTVYHGGLVIGTGARVNQLQKQMQTLQADSAQLHQELAQSQSLVHIQDSDVYHQFQPMANVIMTTDMQTVASR